MKGRTIAIGDIHGCSHALNALLNAIHPDPTDTLITLGDHIDRGPNSCGVVERLIALANQCRLIPLMGNHEELFLAAVRDTCNLRSWLAVGGVETLKSYGWIAGTSRRHLAEWLPEQHRTFLANCQPYHETSTHIFVHAGFQPDLPMDQQPGMALRWRVTDARTTAPHRSGKIAVVGHTPQLTGEILDLGFLICIDTNCHRNGWLTAIDIDTGQIWQADRNGNLR